MSTVFAMELDCHLRQFTGTDVLRIENNFRTNRRLIQQKFQQ